VGRLADLCVESHDVDAAAVFVLDDGIGQNL
jgi:hypothetical protein